MRRMQLARLGLWISTTLLSGVVVAQECGPYTFAAVSVTHVENSTPPTLTFKVMRIGDVTQQVSVQYSTQDITAIAGMDYTATSGTLIFSPYQVLKEVSVSIIQDEIFESPESFQLVLSGKGTQPPVTNGIATIVDDDSPIRIQPVCAATRVDWGTSYYWTGKNRVSYGPCSGLLPPNARELGRSNAER
jgi:hypothetical protein